MFSHNRLMSQTDEHTDTWLAKMITKMTADVTTFKHSLPTEKC